MSRPAPSYLRLLRIRLRGSFEAGDACPIHCPQIPDLFQLGRFGRRICSGVRSPRIDPMDRKDCLAGLIAAAVFGCASLYPSKGAAAVTYYFTWYCTGCFTLGSGSNGREGPFGSHSACESARVAMGQSLNLRGCGQDCFNPQLCQSEGAPDAPPSARQFPAYPQPSIQSSPAPSYGVSGRGRAEEAQREREEAAREALAREGKETPAAPLRDLAGQWRNAVSWYEVRKSAQTIEIVLVETCATADCSRRVYPNRPVFRGRVEGDWLIGVLLIRSAIESSRDSARCSIPAGEFPIKGKVSSDRRRITWDKVEFPTKQGCRTPMLSFGTWRRDP